MSEDERGDWEETSQEVRPGLGVLLSRGALPAVAVMFVIGLGLTIAQLTRNHHLLVERTAVQHAKVYSDTLQKFRGLYNSEVVEKVRKQAPEVKITHDYLTEPNAIPLPITLSRTLDEQISLPSTRTKVYSPLPFEWRKANGGLKDDFARDAWKALNEKPEEPFYRVEEVDGVRALRYAQAERMSDGCVDCHNEYAGSPKTDWESGDVRGVLEVVYPIEQAESLAEGSVWETLGILSPMLLLALAMLGLTNDQYRRWSQSLEGRIKAQERTQQALRRNKARYRTVLETAPDTIMIVSREGTVEYANRTTGAHFAPTEEGTRTFDHMSTGDALKMKEAMEGALQTGNVQSFETSLERNGEERWFSSRVTPLGEDDRLLIFSTDITSEYLARQAIEENADLRSRIDAQTRELLRSRRALLSNEDRLIQVLESLPLGVLVLTPDGQAEYANGNAHDLLSGSVFSTVWSGGGGDFSLLTSTGERYPVDELPSVKALNGESSTVLDIELDIGGNKTPLLVSGAPIFDEQGNVSKAIVAIQDISEQKRLEREADQAQRMQAVGRLAGGVAHDFNNLLTAIVSFGTFALRHQKPGEPGYKDVQQVLQAASRGESLTRQLLSFSKHRPQNPKVVAVNEVVENVDLMLRRLLPGNIEVETKLGDDLLNVRLEADALDQVLVNLALNSRDAMPSGGTLSVATKGVTVDERYAHDHELTLEPGEYVVVVVQDDGTGMDEETQRHMFDPFFTTKGPGRGTGLGLATAWGVVRKAGGTIHVDSAPGKGSTVHVYIPGTSDDVSTDDPNEPGPLVGGNGERILVAEDDDSVRDLLVRGLTDAGYRVLEAADGQEALDIGEISAPGSIDLLVTDVVMPRKNGSELATQIQELHPGTPVLFISGYTDENILPTSKRERSQLLQKPFTPDVLTQRVRDVLDKSGEGERAVHQNDPEGQV